MVIPPWERATGNNGTLPSAAMIPVRSVMITFAKRSGVTSILLIRASNATGFFANFLVGFMLAVLPSSVTPPRRDRAFPIDETVTSRRAPERRGAR